MSWACPVCQEPLERFERSLRCENNHSFDLAKEGHCNLLLANQKNSKEPGDSKVMLQARRDFLNAGYYQSLAQSLVDVLQPHLSALNSKVLDLGCGEGYYSAQLHQGFDSTIKIFGIDIARDGVRMAAKRFKAQQGEDLCPEFAVASSFRLPLLAQQFDAALEVFAPIDEQELARVLKPGGIFCDVSPGPNHLLELKQHLYNEFRDYRQPIEPQGFELIAEQSVEFSMALNSSLAIEQLIAMTPFAHQGCQEAKAQLKALDQFSVQADFLVRVFRLSEVSA